MSGYSSIFASGLLATPRPIRIGTYDSSPTPMDTDDFDTTPTSSRTYTTFTKPFAPTSEGLADEPNDYFSAPRSRTSSTTSTESNVAAAPSRLRRRRSSLSVGSSALASVKSPLRSAGAALQRTLIGGGARSRSGSVNGVTHDRADDVLGSGTTPTTTLKGRLRSGSLATALRPRRAVRKPAPAPPTAPLPALPPLPPLPVAPASNGARRPLLHRASNSDMVGSSYLSADFAPKLAAALTTPPISAQPSPVDGQLLWPGGFKEN